MPTANAAPEAVETPNPGTGDNPEAVGGESPADNEHPEAAPGETTAETIERLKLDLGDGAKEYGRSQIEGLARRGREASRLVSLADKKRQDAEIKEKEVAAKLAKLTGKDVRTVRATLKEMGVNLRDIANEEILEAIEDERLTPEQKRIRELEGNERKRLEAEETQKTEAQKVKEAEEEEQHVEQLSTLFTEVMQKTGLKVGSARAAFHRVAMLYQSAAALGKEVDPDLAAAHVRQTLMDEHKALFTKPDGAMDMDALADWLGEDGWKQVQAHSLARWRARKTPGGATPGAGMPPAVAVRPPKPRAAPATNGPRPGSPEWWRQKGA